MGSKVVVTYKRKRLFSRSDHSIVNLHSGTSHESAKSKTTDNFPKKEGTVTECTLENNGTGFGSHAHSKDDVGEDMPMQCENRDSHCCSEKHVGKSDSHYFARAEEKDPSVSVEAQKFTPEKKCSLEADTKQIIGHPNVRLHGSPEVRNTIDSSGQSNAVESSSECEASKKNLTVSQPPETCSGAEASTLVTDKSNTDQNSRFCNNSGKKRRLSASLITFCRRSKRSRADIAIDSATLPAASFSVNLKNEKELLEENNESCSFSAPAQDTSTVVLADNPQQYCPHGEAADAPNADAHCCQDSNEQMLQLKVYTDVQDNQILSNEGTKSRRMHSDVSGRGDPVSSIDLSIPPHASLNIDCNLPLDGGSDENQPVEMLNDLHDSRGSTSKINEDMSSLPVRASSDKGKSILDSPPLFNCNSSKNNYIQFLPEIRSDGVPQLANNSEKVSRLDPSSLQSSTSIGLSLQPEQMVDGRACFPPSYEWPNVHAELRESFPNTQSLARDKMMLDNIITRARAVRGNRSTFLDKFEYPTTWLDEELDSLWIGVRRHGRGNWDAILGDRRLHFLPWKTSRDLAERWQVEQSRLLCSMPTSQRRYASPPDFSSEHASVLHRPRPEGQTDFFRLSLGRSHPVQNSGFMKGGLSNWLRTAAEIPLDPARLSCAVPLGCHSGPGWLNHPSQQPWLSNRCIGRPVPENGGNGPCSGSPLDVERGKTRPDEHVVSKQEDLIVIPSDTSSEETISD